MKLTAEIELPRWTKTTDAPRQKIVVVRFENQRWEWYPTYDQLLLIYDKIRECEQINKKIKEEST